MLSILQIGEEKSTVIGLMRKAIAQQFTDEVRKLRQFRAFLLHCTCTCETLMYVTQIEFGLSKFINFVLTL